VRHGSKVTRRRAAALAAASLALSKVIDLL
jgi:hypothetical protein